MSRVDVPTLKCDRCEWDTQDLAQMATFRKIEQFHMSGHRTWDLCPVCWIGFTNFLGSEES